MGDPGTTTFGHLELLLKHTDGDSLDCRKENLVLTSRKEISLSAKLPANNTSGHKGVSWNARFGKREVYVHRDGKKVPGGYYEDLEDARKTRWMME